MRQTGKRRKRSCLWFFLGAQHSRGITGQHGHCKSAEAQSQTAKEVTACLQQLVFKKRIHGLGTILSFALTFHPDSESNSRALCMPRGRAQRTSRTELFRRCE